MSFKLVFTIPVFAAAFALAHNHYNTAPEKKTPVETTQDTPIVLTSIKDTNFTIRNKQGEYTYELAPKRETLKLTETSYVPNKRSVEGGNLSQLMFFDNKSTQKFETQFKNSAHCPAPFFNRHSQRKVLLATAPHIQAKLKAWNNPTWKNPDQWNKTTLIGRCVTGTSSFIVKGQDKAPRLPARIFSNCSHFYVESIVSRKPYRT